MTKQLSYNDRVYPQVKLRRYQLSFYWRNSILFGAVAVVVGVGCFGPIDIPVVTKVTTMSSIWITVYWSFAQWIPRIIYGDDDLNQKMNTAAWDFWDSDHYHVMSNKQKINVSSSSFQEEIPTVYIQDHSVDELLPYIESKYGRNWRRRPLLLKGLWKLDELMSTGTSNTLYRRLSLHGLLKENLTIPYFTDARKVGAITPDAVGTIQDIMANITYHSAPHKIATQLLLQTYPELLEEVAPLSIITRLFDHHQQRYFQSSSSYYFTPNAIRGSNGPLQLFPKLTTVPLFVANSHPLPKDTIANSNNDTQSTSLAHTALHCEPIGNIAVQLSGEKLWTLIRPEYSTLLRPYIAPDGRAFFASSLPISHITRNDSRNNRRIPYYQTVTEAGDALWVPTWTWHRVDYVASSSSTFASMPQKQSKASSLHDHDHRITNTNAHHDRLEQSSDIAIGASIFHFRPLGFIQNNPLFAFLIIPAIVLELVGFKTQ